LECLSSRVHLVALHCRRILRIPPAAFQVLLVVDFVALAWDLVAAGFSFPAADLPSLLAGAAESFLAASLYLSLR